VPPARRGGRPLADIEGLRAEAEALARELVDLASRARQLAERLAIASRK
jgi:hypothetical protein